VKKPAHFISGRTEFAAPEIHNKSIKFHHTAKLIVLNGFWKQFFSAAASVTIAFDVSSQAYRRRGTWARAPPPKKKKIGKNIFRPLLCKIRAFR